jgi:hypothetical protein
VESVVHFSFFLEEKLVQCVANFLVWRASRVGCYIFFLEINFFFVCVGAGHLQQAAVFELRGQSFIE